MFKYKRIDYNQAIQIFRNISVCISQHTDYNSSNCKAANFILMLLIYLALTLRSINKKATRCVTLLHSEFALDICDVKQKSVEFGAGVRTSVCLEGIERREYGQD